MLECIDSLRQLRLELDQVLLQLNYLARVRNLDLAQQLPPQVGGSFNSIPQYLIFAPKHIRLGTRFLQVSFLSVILLSEVFEGLLVALVHLALGPSVRLQALRLCFQQFLVGLYLEVELLQFIVLPALRFKRLYQLLRLLLVFLLQPLRLLLPHIQSLIELLRLPR